MESQTYEADISPERLSAAEIIETKINPSTVLTGAEKALLTDLLNQKTPPFPLTEDIKITRDPFCPGLQANDKLSSTHIPYPPGFDRLAA